MNNTEKLKRINEEIKSIKNERKEFNKSKHLGILGIEARLRRGREIDIKRRLA